MFGIILAVVLTVVFCFLVFALVQASTKASGLEEALKSQIEENTRLLDIIGEAGIAIRRRPIEPDDVKGAVREL